MTKLKRRFQYYNRMYFGGRLDPDTKVVWARKIPKAHACFDPGTPPVIQVKSEYRSVWWYWNWLLLHEMAHLATDDQEKQHHGPKWFRTIHALVRKGAYDELF